MKKKTNNLNSVLENIVNQYFGDFSLEKNENEKKEPIVEEKEKKAPIVEQKEQTENKFEKTDPNMFLESLREDFFAMLNTTKKIEEKKELSNHLEDLAKTFFK